MVSTERRVKAGRWATMALDRVDLPAPGGRGL